MRDEIESLRREIRYQWIFLAVLFVLVWVTRAGGQSPLTETRAARAYVEANSQYASDLRFLSLQGVPKERRFEVAKAASYVLNSLASAGTVRNPEHIGGTDLLVFRLSMYWPKNPEYGAAHAAWESLSTNPARFEPYFHVRTVEAGKDEKAANTVKVVNGGWVDLVDADALAKLTKSVGPIIRADWFCSVASVPPAYYEFSSIPKTEAEYDKLLGLDEKTVIDRRAVRAANMNHSGVTAKLRRIARLPTANGSKWKTWDAKDASDLTKDPFQVPDFSLQYDASETIATKRNGLHEYAIWDSKGNRLDFVDPGLAVDDSIHPPVPLVPMLSCIRCHIQATPEATQEDGLRSFVDQQNKLSSGRLVSQDPVVIDLLASLYAPQDKLQLDLARDRQDFVATIRRLAKAADVSSVRNALANTVAAYETALVVPEQAARELGVPANELPKLIGESNLAAIQMLVAGEPVLRGQFEAVFGQASILALSKGVK